MARQSWLDEKQSPQIDQYARHLGSFIDALADGKIDRAELSTQEKKVAELMKEMEPKLDDATHAKVTQLLCELTAYNIMRLLHELQAERMRMATS